MLPTFVIGLREGLEASFIVGIVAAFLMRNGRRSEMWALWTGVGLGVAICLAGGIALRIAERNLPQRQQEGLETVVGLVAVAFVSWMVLWMRAARPRAEGRARGERGRRARDRLGVGAVAHGVPRGAARRLRDRGVPARDPALVDEHGDAR